MTFDPYYTNDHDFVDTLAAGVNDRGAVEATALRSRSLTMRSLLAHKATGGRLLYQDLVRLLREAPGEVGELDLDWTVGLARVVALQTMSQEDLDVALALLEALPESTLKARHMSLYAKLRFERREYAECRRLLRTRYRDGVPGREYLEVDLANPRTPSPYADDAVWHRRFGALFTAHGLEAPDLLPGDASALDRLDAVPRTTVEDGPLVSVVMTTWRPDAKLFTSVRSVIRQSWRNLELLIVDDASGPEHDEVLAQAAAMDPRITVMRQPVNGGTYLARNAAIAVANGEYVTGQDDDDWSHPRRIERQIRPLLDDPQQTATRASTLMADPDLVLDRVGQPTLGHLAPSYMARLDLVREVGGYLEARKGADTELLRRIEQFTGVRVLDIRQPLGVYRLSSTSLSRSEFGPGWHHPVRAAFWSSAHRAHERISAEGLSPKAVRDQVVVPRRYRVRPVERPSYELALAADWRATGGADHPLLDEVRAVAATGTRLALIHLPDHRRPEKRRFEIHPAIQDLINAGTVDRLLVDDDAEIATVMVMQPGVLQLPSEGPSRLEVHRTFVVANQEPSRRANRRVAFVVPECHRHVQRIFGPAPVWVGRNAAIRTAIAPTLRPEHVADVVLPSAVAADRWRVDVLPPFSSRPVIGHHARAGWDWPEKREHLAAAYPTDGSMDVRILGTARHALVRLGHATTPPSWLVYREGETDPRTYLSQLDFYVHVPGRLGGEDSLLSAAFASGRVVVLPHRFEPQYGDAAVYAEGVEVPELVGALHADGARFVAQGERARRYAEAELTTEGFVANLTRLGAIG